MVSMLSTPVRIVRLDFHPIVPNTKEGEGKNRDLKACQAGPPPPPHLGGGCCWSSSATQLGASTTDTEGTSEATRPIRLSPNHWIHCRHTPEWRGGCRGHMSSKAAIRTPPPACRCHPRSTRAASSPPSLRKKTK
jgi:hypothetical protein